MQAARLSRGGMILVMMGVTLILMVLGIFRLIWSIDGVAMVYLPIQSLVLGISGSLTLTKWPYLGLRRFFVTMTVCLAGLFTTCFISAVHASFLPHTLIVSRTDPDQIRTADGWIWYHPHTERIDYLPARVLIENAKFGIYFTAQEDPVELYRKYHGPIGYMDALQFAAAELTRDIQQDQFASIRDMTHATTLRLEYGFPVKGKVEVLPKIRSGG